MARAISKILLILGLYKFLAYLEYVRSYAWCFGLSDPDISSVSRFHTNVNVMLHAYFQSFHLYDDVKLVFFDIHTFMKTLHRLKIQNDKVESFWETTMQWASFFQQVFKQRLNKYLWNKVAWNGKFCNKKDQWPLVRMEGFQ